jgi:RNA polymerase primary sigma factor
MTKVMSSAPTHLFRALLVQARRQGYLTLSELAQFLPAGASVEQTTKLITALEKYKVPLLHHKGPPEQAKSPTAVPPEHAILSREQEYEITSAIHRGMQRRIEAAAGSPATAARLVRVARQVVSGSCPVWQVLADFVGSHPDEDESQAIGTLSQLVRDLGEPLRRMRRHRLYRYPQPAAEGSSPEAQMKHLVLDAFLKLDLRDAFVERLISPITAAAARVEFSRQELAEVERSLSLQPGSLGDIEQIQDKQLRKVLQSSPGNRRLWQQAHRRVKNSKRRIRASLRHAEMDPHRLLLAAQEIRAGAAQAQSARQKIVEANQRLVIGIARRYPHPGLDFLDLVQEGNLGLMRAADRFDPELGFRFGTYATWWVRQSIGRLLAEQGGSVRIPPHVQESLHKLKRLSRRMVVQTGQEPTVEQLAHSLGKSPERIGEILSARGFTVSADSPVGDSEDAATLLDFIPDPHAKPDEEADQRVRFSILQEALEALNPREREIVELRFQDGLTLQDVGDRFSITRERARQLQEQAIGKLRKRIKADLLRKLTDHQRPDSPGPTNRRKRRTKARIAPI